MLTQWRLRRGPEYSSGDNLQGDATKRPLKALERQLAQMGEAGSAEAGSPRSFDCDLLMTPDLFEGLICRAAAMLTSRELI